jgi:hypothetical protein
MFLLIAMAGVAAACSTPSAPTSATSTAMAPVPTPPAPVPMADPVARYVVTFDSTWSAQSHPTDWPDNAHYSGLIGGTHSASVSFWQDGQPASPGIRAMAERGRKSPLDQEVIAAIAAGNAQHVLSGDALSDSPGRVSLEFDIGIDFPLVTLVTMVAPSPDWFVGVTGLPLLVDGQWTESVTATLYPWDAGTDSGATYEADDQETRPAALIHRLLGFPVIHNGAVQPFGTMVFTRRK